MSEEAEVFSLMSMVFQFYIFKVFDKNFKASFSDLRRKLLATLMCKKTPTVTARVSHNCLSTNSIELRNLANLIGNGLID